MTSIHGLEAFGVFGHAVWPRLYLHLPLLQGVNLKAAAKLFAQRFATGASVTKNPQGQEEIVIQGDVSDDVLEMIEGKKEKIFSDVPEDNIELVEDKKKKGGEE